jgi:signal transduction histidine kinase
MANAESISAQAEAKTRHVRHASPGSARTTRIGTLADDALTVELGVVVSEVRLHLEGCSPLSSVVVVEGLRPVGLIMNYSLSRALSTQFGRGLFLKRSVEYIMDRTPLVVDAEETIEVVTNRALDRDDSHLYDDIIVTQNDALLGSVAVQGILETLARAEGVLELAGAAAHELNQPLQVIMGYCGLLGRTPSDDQRCLHWERIVQQQVLRMANITRKLQNAMHYETKPYLDDTRILDLDKVGDT